MSLPERIIEPAGIIVIEGMSARMMMAPMPTHTESCKVELYMAARSATKHSAPISQGPWMITPWAMLARVPMRTVEPARAWMITPSWM